MDPDAQVRATYLAGLSLAALGAVLLSAKAIIAKLLYRHGIDAVTLIALRMLLAGPVFLAVAAWTWRRQPRLSAADLWRIVGLGLVGYYGSSMLDFIGLQYITAGLERLILFLTPSFVLLLGWLLYARPVGSAQLGSLGMAYAGIALVFWHDVSLGGEAVVLGAGCVFGAAMLYAAYLLYSGELLQRVGTLRLVALAMLVSTVACLVQYALLRPWSGLFDQSAEVWRLSALNAGLCTVLPVFLTMLGVARAGAGAAAQAGMIGPVSTLLLAWWWLAEPITMLQLAGTGLVLVGIVWLSLPTRVRAAPVVP